MPEAIVRVPVTDPRLTELAAANVRMSKTILQLEDEISRLRVYERLVLGGQIGPYR